jgi:predicted site-specific integrase-resolvase
MPDTPILDTLESQALPASHWAAKLKVAPSTITRWALEGQVDYAQVGREIRIAPEAMERCLRERREARQRRYRARTAGTKARDVADAAEVDQELAEI